MNTIDTMNAMLNLHEGTICAFVQGFIEVQSASGEDIVRCHILRTSAAPLALSLNDKVLFVRNADTSAGYILGKIEAYSPAPLASEPSNQAEVVKVVEVVELVESIEIQPDRRQNIRMNGKRITVEASEKLTLVCGESSLEMDRHGKVTLKGVDVNSRARRSNKIKGGNIALN